MAFVQGRVQRCDNANGIGLATIADNLGNFASADVNGFWYTYYAYPGYRLTASAGGFYAKSHDFTEGDVNSGWVTICLDATPPPPPGCCFTGDTRVILADGQEASIQSLEVGDWVLGPDGEPAQVIAIEMPLLGTRLLYGLNDTPPFFTAEHPFKSASGWKAIDPGATWLENPGLLVDELSVGAELVVTHGAVGGGRSSRSGTAVLERLALEVVTLREITVIEAEATTQLYNLRLESGHEYLANGYAVHNKW